MTERTVLSCSLTICHLNKSTNGPKFGTYSDWGFQDFLLLINILHITVLISDHTACVVEDETPVVHRNAKRNPNRNHETIVLGLFSSEFLKRDLE